MFCNGELQLLINLFTWRDNKAKVNNADEPHYDKTNNVAV